MDMIARLSDLPEVCIMLSVLLFLMSVFMIYSLLDGLLKMHRSKSAVKKLMKEYTFLQKMWLIPFENHCLHAVKFCKGLVWFQRIRCLSFGTYFAVGMLTLLNLVPNSVLACMSAMMFVIFDIPEMILYRLVSRPIFGRFKEYSFEKYHNTKDHDSLL